ncbi:MAG: hypothetical protein K0U21_07845 [Proteobacteria bacterium]|nr:hypothetical protein [Pseudomonadota bacterium]
MNSFCFFIALFRDKTFIKGFIKLNYFNMLLSFSMVSLLSGCVAAIPSIVAGVNGATKKGNQYSTLTCRAFPSEAFKKGAAVDGGVITSPTPKSYLRADYSANNVKVELQTITESQDYVPAVYKNIEKQSSKKRNSKKVVEQVVIAEEKPSIPGEYQVVGSSNNGVSRIWEFEDGIGKTTQSVVDTLIQSGCTLVVTKREEAVTDKVGLTSDKEDQSKAR